MRPARPWLPAPAGGCALSGGHNRGATAAATARPAKRKHRSANSMNTKLGKLMVSYGSFLMAMGLVGYLSNPDKAMTALISGGLFGGLSVLWGILLARSQSWSRWAALATTGLLAAVFAWRASVSWAAFSAGQPEKWVAATIISAMGLASLFMLTLLSAGCGLRCARRQRHVAV